MPAPRVMTPREPPVNEHLPVWVRCRAHVLALFPADSRTGSQWQAPEMHGSRSGCSALTVACLHDCHPGRRQVLAVKAP